MRSTWMAGLALVAACGGASEGPQAAAVRDSAGITIVENTTGTWAAGEGWSLSAEPTVQVGGDATSPGLDFSRIAGALQLADGSLAVADGGSSEIRFYDASGAFQRSSGRPGSGPGEYAGIMGMWLTPADSLVVLDIMVRRLTVLGPDGGVGRSFHLAGMGGAMVPGADGNVVLAIPAGLLSDGSMIGLSMGFQINSDREGSYRDSIPAVHFGADGAVLDTVGWYPGMEMEAMELSFAGQTVRVPTGVPLGRNTIALAARGRFYVATNDAWEVQAWEPGRGLVTLIRVNQPPRALNSAGVDQHREELIEQMDAQGGANMPPQLREQMVERVNSAPYPATIPFVVNMLMDDTGHLWVQEQDQPGDRSPRFGVFTPEGQLLGWVDMPERFRPTHITGNAVVGVWQDEDDVEYLQVYTLTRGS
jgi:hypothetical protein